MQQETNFVTPFLIFENNKLWHLRMKYHTLFDSKIWNCCLLQIVGGALWVNVIGGCSFENSADLEASQSESSLFSFIIWIMDLNANSKESDQTAPYGAVWSGSTLLALKTFKMKQEGDEFICEWQWIF